MPEHKKRGRVDLDLFLLNKYFNKYVLLNKTRKSQVSMEFLLVMGFAFLMIIPLIVVFYTHYSGMNIEIENAQAEKVMNELVDAVDSVNYLGEPSQKTIKLHMPSTLKDITISPVNNKVLVFTIDNNGVINNMSKLTSANLTGSLSGGEGLHVFKLRAQGTFVVIEELR
ncbi:hypothetical protein JW949_02520 [Candidatus Woesearchaeota archaeon]|nr:hypothetical protein [Candidatus Woesearchaeota archaeon]